MKNTYLKEKWYKLDFNKISKLENYGTFNKEFKVKSVDAVKYNNKSVRFIEKKSVLENIDFLEYLVNSRLYGFQSLGYTKSELYQIRDDVYSRAYINILEYKGDFIPPVKIIVKSIQQEVRFYYGRREVQTPQATNYNVISSGLEVYNNVDAVQDDSLNKILSNNNVRRFILDSKDILSKRQFKAIKYASGLSDDIEYLTGTDKDAIKSIAVKYFK